MDVCIYLKFAYWTLIRVSGRSLNKNIDEMGIVFSFRKQKKDLEQKWINYRN